MLNRNTLPTVAGLLPRKLRSALSPKRNASGTQVSNLAPPMMKWEAKYGPGVI